MPDPNHPDAEYLGDAVYADTVNNMITLTTDSHRPVEAGNIIYLEPRVLEALIRYAKKKGIIND